MNVVCNWYWVIVAFVAGAVLLWMALTDDRLKPLLTKVQECAAIDHIIIYCQGDYTHTRALIDELRRYMEDQHNDEAYSNELLDIVEKVKNIK